MEPRMQMFVFPVVFSTKEEERDFVVFSCFFQAAAKQRNLLNWSIDIENGERAFTFWGCSVGELLIKVVLHDCIVTEMLNIPIFSRQ